MARLEFDSALVGRAQAGEGAARETLLARLEPLLRAYFIRRIGPRTEVDDLVQNTLLRVYNGLADLKDTRRLKSFSMKAALFELQDFYRGRYSTKEYLYDPERPPEPAGGTTLGQRVDVEKALAALSPKARRIIELREYGYRYEEIAGMIGSTEAAIKMQVKRAFEKMREALTLLLLAWPALWAWLR